MKSLPALPVFRAECKIALLAKEDRRPTEENTSEATLLKRKACLVTRAAVYALQGFSLADDGHQGSILEQLTSNFRGGKAMRRSCGKITCASFASSKAKE